MKVLVPVDGSPASDAAVDAVNRQFDPSTTDVSVLHVVELPLTVPESLAFAEAAAAAGIVEEAVEERRRQGHQIAARAVERFRANGFGANVRVVDGEAKLEILEVAGSWAADVIVMGSHGRSGFERLVMGSVAEYVLRHAECSVEIVRPAHEAVRKAS